MTDRLYYRDSALLVFKAEIIEEAVYQDRFYTVLDRSAFYPTSGGQLYDTGILNGVAVIDVIEAENHDVWHITEKQVGRVGDKVEGIVDKERRRKHRQVHTAQHILSQAFIRVGSGETVSVHLGEEYANLELNIDQISPEKINEAEKLANDIVLDNLPVEVIFADEDLLQYLPIRKIPERKGILRVIKIGDFECSACGGTHCNRTSEVGFIKIIGSERIRGRILINFWAGQQVFEDYLRRFAVTDLLSKSFTCHVTDLPDKINKLTVENKTANKEIVRLQRELLPVKVSTLAQEAKITGKVNICTRIINDLDNNAVNQLAVLVADKINGLAFFMTADRMFLAVSENSGLHAGELIKQLALLVDVKGGGNRKTAQAGNVESDKFDLYRDMILKLAND